MAFDNSLMSAWTHASVVDVVFFFCFCIFFPNPRKCESVWQSGFSLQHWSTVWSGLEDGSPPCTSAEIVAFYCPIQKKKEKKKRTGTFIKNRAACLRVLSDCNPVPPSFPVTSWTLSEAAWRSPPGCCRCGPGRHSRTTSSASRSPAGTRIRPSSGSGRRS